MKLISRTRIASGLAALAVAATAGLAAPASSQAATTFVPSAADFKNCPVLPAGSTALLWNCVSVTIVGGTVKMGAINQTITDPLQINVAVGPVNGKLTTITGNLAGSTIKVPTGINFPGFDTIEIAIEQAGDMQSNGLVPTAVPVKAHAMHWILGPVCYIGSDSDPIVIHPALGNLRLENMSGTTVIRTDVTDSTFAVPEASGCGLFTSLVNSIGGLPSASGNNALNMDTVVQIKNYVLGNITTTAAAKLR